MAASALLDKYIANDDPYDNGILGYWQVRLETCIRARQCRLSHILQRHASWTPLYRLALDILSAQASAVSCERLLSSAKETTTARRNRVGTVLMEALQSLKFLYKSQRIIFKIAEELCQPSELTVPDTDPPEISRESLRAMLLNKSPTSQIPDVENAILHSDIIESDDSTSPI